MAAPTYRFSPFAQRQPSSVASGRNAPGRSAASPGVGNSAGRTPHVHGEQHDDATSQETASTVGGRVVPDADARRLASAVPVASSLERLAARLRRGSQDARRIADNAEILSRRLQRELPHPSAGLAYAVNEHAELSDALADAHAFVVRCAAQPKLLEILAALESGEQVLTVRAHDPSVLFSAADNRPARAGVVGDDVNPTSGLPKLVSGFLKLVAGHRKSSTSAHLSAPSAAMTQHRTGDFQSAGKAFQRSGNDRAR